jgi:hypothetical protein
MRHFFSFTLMAMLLLATALSARQNLTQQQLKLLQDPGGWQYITVTDPDSGIQTKHTCFDGKPHPEECSGTLTLKPENTFVQGIHIHGQQVQRHGTYQLTGNQLAFYDEFGTQDGPYTIAIDAEKNVMTIEMPQVHLELMLERAYRDAIKKANQHKIP